MSWKSSAGLGPRLGHGAHAAGLAAIAAALIVMPGLAAAKAPDLEFKGELNYEAFERARAERLGVRLTRSPGGSGAAAMMLGRVERLVIDGPCNSACAWAFVGNDKACFTRRASFGFHGAHDPGTGRRMLAATDYWLSTVSEPLRKRLTGLRTSSGIIRVRASEMLSYYRGRACS